MATDIDNRVWPDIAIPPGEGLAEELEAREMSIDRFAASLCVPKADLVEVLEGLAPITAPLALQLESELGISAVFWMNLQTDYDLTLARIARNEANALPH
jgi:HTH-type transcriptional regulator / antitoxin HigA